MSQATSAVPATLPALFDLTAKVAVVTGGGTHLGRALAATLARAGAEVHIVGRRAEPIARTVRDLVAEGLDLHGHMADVADEEAVEAVLDAALLGRQLDILIANAGGRTGTAAAPHIPMHQWWHTFRLTVGTAAVTAQAAARRMCDGGRIVLLGSIHGSLGADPRVYAAGYQPSGSDYHAAKGAVVNLARSLACALGPHGITVNCISPGQIPPAGADADTVELFRRATPLGQVGEPNDLSGIALVLASGAGRFITGQNIVVDGGWSSW